MTVKVISIPGSPVAVDKGYGSVSIKGTITDQRKEPLTNASISAFLDDTLKGGAITDIDGNYSIGSLPPGKYKIRVSYIGAQDYFQEIAVSDKVIVVNAILKVDQNQKSEKVILMGKKLLVDPKSGRIR